MDEYRRFDILDGSAVRELPDRSSFTPEVIPELGYEQESEAQRISESRERAGQEVHPRKAPERERQTVSLSAVAGFVLVAFLAVGVLASNIRLDSVYAATVKQQKALVQLEGEYSRLKAADEEIFDSESLKKVAEEHGLTKTKVNQKVYLELSDPNHTVVYSRQEKTSGLAAVAEWFRDLLGLSA